MTSLTKMAGALSLVIFMATLPGVQKMFLPTWYWAGEVARLEREISFSKSMIDTVSAQVKTGATNYERAMAEQELSVWQEQVALERADLDEAMQHITVH